MPQPILICIAHYNSRANCKRWLLRRKIIATLLWLSCRSASPNTKDASRVRIDTLTYHNVETQGARRRAWLREHSPQHLQQCAALIHAALEKRPPSVSPGTLVLGAGACTEIPLEELARHSDEVALADFDLASMQQARSELASPALRRHIRLLEGDISGGISASLHRLITQQPWDT